MNRRFVVKALLVGLGAATVAPWPEHPTMDPQRLWRVNGFDVFWGPTFIDRLVPGVQLHLERAAPGFHRRRILAFDRDIGSLSWRDALEPDWRIPLPNSVEVHELTCDAFGRHVLIVRSSGQAWV